MTVDDGEVIAVLGSVGKSLICDDVVEPGAGYGETVARLRRDAPLVHGRRGLRRDFTDLGWTK
jgi:hypothetical protein